MPPLTTPPFNLNTEALRFLNQLLVLLLIDWIDNTFPNGNYFIDC